MDPDQQLMLRVREGDKAAFEALYRRHGGAVLNYVHRMLGGAVRERAEEVTQDVFVKLYNARAGYEPAAKFTTYLYRIATNACLNERARSEHRFDVQALGAPGPGGGPALELPDPGAPNAEDALVREAASARVRAALERLTDAQRAALVMREYDDLPYEDIAGALRTTVPAVKGLLHRAREALRALLGDREA